MLVGTRGERPAAESRKGELGSIHGDHYRLADVFAPSLETVLVLVNERRQRYRAGLKRYRAG